MTGDADVQVQERVPSRQGGAWRVQAFHNCPERVNRDAQ